LSSIDKSEFTRIIADLKKKNKNLVGRLDRHNLSTATNKALEQTALIGELSKKSGSTIAGHPRAGSVKNPIISRNGDKDREEDVDGVEEDDDDDDEENSSLGGKVERVVDSIRRTGYARAQPETSNDEDSEEESDDLNFKLHDFRWRSSSQQTGYLVVTFDDSETTEEVDLKTMLHDFPEEVIRFMWEKYGRSQRTMSYVEKCAKSDILLEGMKKKVFSGFKTLKCYLAKMSWNDSTPGHRMQQQPAWDTKPNRKTEPKKGRAKQIPNRGNEMIDKRDNSVLGGGTETRGVQLGDVAGSAARGGRGEVNNDQCLNASRRKVNQMIENVDEEGEVQEMSVESTDFENSDEELIDCAAEGENHDWEEFADRAWVREGQLLYQKQCIGKRDGVVCGKMFVEHTIVGTNVDNQYCPTVGHPAWGCKKCRQAMCDPCRDYYVAFQRLQSPGRNSGVGTDRANKRGLAGG
jgi:hypothetical protein